MITDGTYVEEIKSVQKENYIAALGRLHPVKGYDILIESLLKYINNSQNYFLKLQVEMMVVKQN